MVNLQQMIKDIYDCMGWPYVTPGGTGKDCSTTGIDCSGLIRRAYKLQGYDIPHGSNAIWRQSLTDNKGLITSEKDLYVGAGVFKWNPNTPAKYKDDLGDFQHFGVVTRVNPLRIVHASSAAGCVTEDTKIGKWKYVGQLKAVDYNGRVVVNTSTAPAPGNKTQEVSNMKGYVTADSGDTVNLRASTSTSSDRVAKVPVASEVEILGTKGDWYRIKYAGNTGYMMKKFVLTEAQVDVGDSNVAVDGDLQAQINELREDIQRLYERLAVLEGGFG